MGVEENQGNLSGIAGILVVIRDHVDDLPKADWLKYPSWSTASEYNRCLAAVTQIAGDEVLFLPPKMGRDIDALNATQPYVDLRMNTDRLHSIVIKLANQ